MAKVYRIGHSLYVQDFTDPYTAQDMIDRGEDPETIYLEKVKFRPMEFFNPFEGWDYHPYKVEIFYTEEYYSLPDLIGCNSLEGFSCFDAGDC